MNQHRIKIFITIARVRSISGTARALHYAQPTVSAALNQLEKEVGTQLVIRGQGAHQIYLTPAGEAFLPIARRWLEADEQVEYFKQAQEKKVLRLAANSNGHEFVVGYVVQKLRQRLPTLEIRLIDVAGPNIGSAIDNNLFDIAFFYGQPFSRTRAGTFIDSKELYQEERYVICPADTCLPDRPLLPNDLDPNMEVIHGLAQYSHLAEWRKNTFPSHKERPIAVENISAIPAYLVDPRSWALLPISVVRAKIASSEGRLTYRRLADPPPARSMCALISKSYPETKVIREFLECCSEYIEERPYLIRSLRFPVLQK